MPDHMRMTHAFLCALSGRLGVVPDDPLSVGNKAPAKPCICAACPPGTTRIAYEFW